MKKLFFAKMSGAGNDFIVFDKKVNQGLMLNSEAIRKLCDRRNGIGADGIITIGDSDKYDFTMEYFNSDGSTGSLCGNGARCAIKFAESTKRVKDRKAKFISNGSSYSGEILSESQVKVYFNEPQKFKYNFKVKTAGQLINASYVNTGSPHVVINVMDILKNLSNPKSFYNNINDIPVLEMGREIRNLPEFLPEGTNVNFYLIDNNRYYIRTYERGVEDETLACGTGNAATALVINKVHNISPPINLITRGGDQLVVEFESEKNIIKNLTLTGPVKNVFNGEILSNNILN
jgi:diaminopimelate epimerase